MIYQTFASTEKIQIPKGAVAVGIGPNSEAAYLRDAASGLRMAPQSPLLLGGSTKITQLVREGFYAGNVQLAIAQCGDDIAALRAPRPPLRKDSLVTVGAEGSVTLVLPFQGRMRAFASLYYETASAATGTIVTTRARHYYASGSYDEDSLNAYTVLQAVEDACTGFHEVERADELAITVGNGTALTVCRLIALAFDEGT